MTLNRNAIPVLAILAATGLAMTACEEKPAGTATQGQSVVDQAKSAGAEVKREAEQAVDKAVEAAAKARTEFVNTSTEQLKTLEKDIGEFIASARERMPSGGAELNRMRDELNNQVAKAKVELQKVQSAGADAWEDASKSFTNSYNEIRRTFAQVKEQFSASMPKLPGS
ncbi:MAG: hypothetical protein KF684_11380 [Phycisphaeraceae bacterium]|nr:hypothetical protein [Phycisphaeraceae bacterium]